MSQLQLIDTPYSLLGRVQAIQAKGIAGAIRYISPNTGNFPNKRLTQAEVAEAADNQFWLGTVWEVMGSAAEMCSAVGKVHGVSATQVALWLKQPSGSAIGFAVDYDAPESDFDAIADYFTEVHAACKGDGYLVTAYGSEAVAQFLVGKGLAHYAWLSGAKGWNESRFATDETINQINAGDVTVAGLSVDLDALTGSVAADPTTAGLWLPTT